MILHSPYGLRVHGPLALAVARRLRERYGIDEKPTASDDGIIVRLPDTEDAAPGCRSVRVRRRRDRADRDRRGRRLGAVRVAVPRMRGPRAAAAAPASGQALAAVASAAARRAAARRRPQVPGLPDRAGGGPRMPAGRLRRPGTDRADAPRRAAPAAGARGRDRDAVPVRGLAAVRLRRRVHVRGRQPAGRAARRGAVAGQRAAGRTAGPRRAARAARPAGHRHHHAGSCSTSARTGRLATPRASPTCCGCSGR